MALKTLSWTTQVWEEYRVTLDESEIPAGENDSFDSFLAGMEIPENRRDVSVADRNYDILDA